MGPFSLEKIGGKNPPKNPQQNSNQNLGVSRPKSTLQESGLDKLCKFVSRSDLVLDADDSLDFFGLSRFTGVHLVLQRFRQSRRISVFALDASFLLTVEAFLLTVRLFYLRWGNREQNRPNPISGQGEP